MLALGKEAERAAREYGRANDVKPQEAADKLVVVAVGRLAALAKYARAQKRKEKAGGKGSKARAAKRAA